jgi:hypothetical protein
VAGEVKKCNWSSNAFSIFVLAPWQSSKALFAQDLGDRRWPELDVLGGELFGDIVDGYRLRFRISMMRRHARDFFGWL